MTVRVEKTHAYEGKYDRSKGDRSFSLLRLTLGRHAVIHCVWERVRVRSQTLTRCVSYEFNTHRSFASGQKEGKTSSLPRRQNQRLKGRSTIGTTILCDQWTLYHLEVRGEGRAAEYTNQGTWDNNDQKWEGHTLRDGQPDAGILSDYGSLAVVEMVDLGPTPSPILLLTVVNLTLEDLWFFLPVLVWRERRTDRHSSLTLDR